MKKYKVFTHPSDVNEVVKQGWSWPAFCFGPIWAMVKRMWLLGLGSLIFLFVLQLVLGNSVSGQLANVVIEMIIFTIFGIQGNSWRENNLFSRGFESGTTVTAANPEGALALHLKGKK